MQTRVKAVCGGIVAALLSFVPLFSLFDRAFIAYWEWQHEGRRMKITLWADDRAFLLALCLCAVVFYVTVRYLERRLSVAQKIKRQFLLIGAASGVFLVYVSVLAYVLIIVSRFGS
jgi:hypothetical protein